MTRRHFPPCACGGELAPPLRARFVSFVDRENAAGPNLVNEYEPAPDVTEAEEEAANATEDAAIVRCRACGVRLVLHSDTRPDRYRRHTTPDQSVFE